MKGSFVLLVMLFSQAANAELFYIDIPKVKALGSHIVESDLAHLNLTTDLMVHTTPQAVSILRRWARNIFQNKSSSGAATFNCITGSKIR